MSCSDVDEVRPNNNVGRLQHDSGGIVHAAGARNRWRLRWPEIAITRNHRARQFRLAMVTDKITQRVPAKAGIKESIESTAPMRRHAGRAVIRTSEHVRTYELVGQGGKFGPRIGRLETGHGTGASFGRESRPGHMVAVIVR